jgi:YYY domain-containing protein
MGSLVLWWLLIEGLGLLALPLTVRVFSAGAQHGYAFAKIIAVLLVTYSAWLLGCAGVPYGTALLLAVAILAALNIGLAWRDLPRLRQWLGGPDLRALLITDLLFLAAFLFFAWQRSLQPQIVDQEKYMDFAFFNTLLRTEVMPPEDPWMSGMTFNYYYFGYLMFANLARLMPMASAVSYNLCVATIAGAVFTEMCAIGLILTRRLWAAVLTGALGILAGNVDGLLQLLERGSFLQFDYFRSTRIVGRDATINEFPYFTAIHGDLHPHFLVMPVTILLLALLLDPERLRGLAERGIRTFRDLWPYVPITFTLGAMVAISTWELPVGAMTTFLLLHRYLPLRPLITKARLQVLGAVLVMLVAGYLLFLPFYLSFAAPQGGVGVKLATTSLAEFLTVFGGLLLLPGVYLAGHLAGRLSLKTEQLQLIGAAIALAAVVGLIAGKAVLLLMLAFVAAAVVATYTTDDGEERAPILLILAGCSALLACEIVFIRDPYGERLYRMNTVFKLYLQAWFLLAAAGPWCAVQLMRASWSGAILRRMAFAVTGAVVLAAACYPIGVTATRLQFRHAPATLDGNAYLEREHPDDFAVIEWIRANVTGLPVILEATGNPYSYYARFASNTGLPTIMGWANHEGLWRSHEPGVEQRKQEVARIYNATNLEDVNGLLDRYRVRYIVVGELERKDYKASGLEKFKALKVAFASNGTTLYER